MSEELLAFTVHTHFLECVNAEQQMRFQMHVAGGRFDQPNAIEVLLFRIIADHIHHRDGTAKRFDEATAVRGLNDRLIAIDLRQITYSATIAQSSVAFGRKAHNHQWARRINDGRSKFCTGVRA